MEELKAVIKDYSEKAGSVNQKLALGGIAIVWLFKETTEKQISLDKNLIFSLACFVAALAFELLHYAFFAVIYRIWYNRLRKQKDSKPDDFKDSKVHDVTWVFFVLKILAVVVGYILVGSEMLERIKF